MNNRTDSDTSEELFLATSPSDATSEHAISPAFSAFPLPSQVPSTPSELASMIVISDPKAISAMLEQLLTRSNLSVNELCRRLGVSRASLNQYRFSRRTRPSIQFFSRVVEACGGRLIVELPQRPLR